MKLFEKYELNDVVVHDAGLAKYMNLSPIVIPHTGGRWANKPFGKAKANLVERLINNMMRTENYTGKKSKSYRVVRSAFEIIEKRTQKNPVQSSWTPWRRQRPRGSHPPRFGGISVPRAVDVAPSRPARPRSPEHLPGNRQRDVQERKPVEECLADEILLARRATCKLRDREERGTRTGRLVRAMIHFPPDRSLIRFGLLRHSLFTLRSPSGWDVRKKHQESAGVAPSQGPHPQHRKPHISIMEMQWARNAFVGERPVDSRRRPLV